MKKHIIDDVDLIFESYVNSFDEDVEDVDDFDFTIPDINNIDLSLKRSESDDEYRKETLQKILDARSFNDAKKIFEEYILQSNMKEDKKAGLISYIRNVIAKKFGTRLYEIKRCAKNTIYWKDEK